VVPLYASQLLYHVGLVQSAGGHIRSSPREGDPAVRDVPFGPAPLCVGIVTSPNPSMFAQVTIANLVIIMPSL